MEYGRSSVREDHSSDFRRERRLSFHRHSPPPFDLAKKRKEDSYRPSYRSSVSDALDPTPSTSNLSGSYYRPDTRRDTQRRRRFSPSPPPRRSRSPPPRYTSGYSVYEGRHRSPSVIRMGPKRIDDLWEGPRDWDRDRDRESDRRLSGPRIVPRKRSASFIQEDRSPSRKKSWNARASSVVHSRQNSKDHTMMMPSLLSRISDPITLTGFASLPPKPSSLPPKPISHPHPRHPSTTETVSPRLSHVTRPSEHISPRMERHVSPREDGELALSETDGNQLDSDPPTSHPVVELPVLKIEDPGGTWLHEQNVDKDLDIPSHPPSPKTPPPPSEKPSFPERSSSLPTTLLLPSELITSANPLTNILHPESPDCPPSRQKNRTTRSPSSSSSSRHSPATILGIGRQRSSTPTSSSARPPDDEGSRRPSLDIDLDADSGRHCAPPQSVASSPAAEAADRDYNEIDVTHDVSKRKPEHMVSLKREGSYVIVDMPVDNGESLQPVTVADSKEPINVEEAGDITMVDVSWSAEDSLNRVSIEEGEHATQLEVEVDHTVEGDDEVDELETPQPNSVLTAITQAVGRRDSAPASRSSEPQREESVETVDVAPELLKPSFFDVLTPYLLQSDVTEEAVERVLCQSKAFASVQPHERSALIGGINSSYYTRDISTRMFDSLMKDIQQREIQRKQKYDILVERYWNHNLAWAKHRSQMDEEKNRIIADRAGWEASTVELGETPRRLTRSNTALPRSDYVPEAEMVNAYDWIMTNDDKDPILRGHKSQIQPPDMLLSKFDRINPVCECSPPVTDPIDFYKNETANVEWTEDECTTFYKAFQIHTKNFGKIAELLPGKSIEDVIRFYYQKKSIFKWRDLAKKGKKGNGGRKSRIQPAKPKGRMLANLRGKFSDDEDELISASPAPLTNIVPISIVPNSPAVVDENVDELEEPHPANSVQPRRSGRARTRPKKLIRSESTTTLPQNHQHHQHHQNHHHHNPPNTPSLHTWPVGNNIFNPPTLQSTKTDVSPIPTRTPSLPPQSRIIVGPEQTPISAHRTNRKRPRVDDGKEGSISMTMQSVQPSLVSADSTHHTSKRVSSYWSLKEKEDYHTYLQAYGEDFERIATKIGTKTAQQCRNMFNRERAPASSTDANYTKGLKNDNKAPPADKPRSMPPYDIIPPRPITFAALPSPTSPAPPPAPSLLASYPSQPPISSISIKQDEEERCPPPRSSKIHSLLNDEPVTNITKATDWFGPQEPLASQPRSSSPRTPNVEVASSMPSKASSLPTFPAMPDSSFMKDYYRYSTSRGSSSSNPDSWERTRLPSLATDPFTSYSSSTLPPISGSRSPYSRSSPGYSSPAPPAGHFTLPPLSGSSPNMPYGSYYSPSLPPSVSLPPPVTLSQSSRPTTLPAFKSLTQPPSSFTPQPSAFPPTPITSTWDHFPNKLRLPSIAHVATDTPPPPSH